MTIKIGVIGCGQIARHRHIPEYAANKDVELVAFCDIDQEKARTLAAKYGGKKVFTDYQELLAQKEVQAVSICTSNYLHAPITIAAAEAGKHILVEKPMATSLKEADAMIQAAARNKVFLMVAHNQRLAPMHQIAKKIIDSGMMGRVYSVRTSFGHAGPENWSPTGKWFFKKTEAFAGAMADLGVHKADLMRWLLGKEVVEVGAFVTRLEKQGDVDDNAVCILKFADGAIGTLTASWTFKPQEDNSTIIYCEKGTLKLAAEPGRPVVAYLSEPGRGEMVFEVPKLQTNEEGGQFTSGVIDTFLECIRNDHPPAISGEEGKKALEIVLAAFRSAETGQIVKLPLR